MYKNIVLHWTGGNYFPCPLDIESYHYLVNAQGKIQIGKFKPSDNLNCTDGFYAKHCGGGNTGRIGIAICCRKDIKTVPTKKQIESMCKLSAELCHKYGLQPSQVITHAEFGQTHPKTSSYRKIDITEIPYANLKGIKECGDYLREKVQWYYTKCKEK